MYNQHRLDALKSELSVGRISRRSFIQSAVAVGVSVSAATMLADQAMANTPKRGGHARFGMQGNATTDSWDPATMSTEIMYLGTGAVFSALMEVSPTGDLIGDLAESVESSPDAKTWTFKLRKGIEFHNGKTLTAEDVVATVNYHRGEDSKSTAKSFLAPVTDVKADGDNVVFDLDSGNADFPYYFAAPAMYIVPSSDGVPDVLSGIGTGAYSVKAFEPGVRMELERVANDYRSDRGFFDSAELIGVNDQNARMSGLVSGSFDAINKVDARTADLLKAKDGVNILVATGTAHYTWPMHSDTAPFDDNNVRLALKHAYDREQFIAKVLRGYGQIANDHPISPANRYFNKDLEQRHYDPDKAKYYLKQAGLSSLKVDISASDGAFSGSVDGAVLFAEAAREAGIELNVIREPADGYWGQVWNKKPFCAAYWSGRLTEDWMFTQAYYSKAKWNDSRFNNERFDQLLVDARAELDEAKRREMYGEMQALVRDEGGTIIPAYLNFIAGYSDKVGVADNVGSNYEMDGFHAIERWWSKA